MAIGNYSVQIKRGTRHQLDSVPQLREGELCYVTDEEELYIGTSDGNKRVTSNTVLFGKDYTQEVQDNNASNSNTDNGNLADPNNPFSLDFNPDDPTYSSVFLRLHNTDIRITELRDALRDKALISLSSEPFRIDDLNNLSAVRSGLVSVDESSSNLPPDFVID